MVDPQIDFGDPGEIDFGSLSTDAIDFGDGDHAGGEIDWGGVDADVNVDPVVSSSMCIVWSIALYFFNRRDWSGRKSRKSLPLTHGSQKITAAVTSIVEIFLHSKLFHRFSVVDVLDTILNKNYIV